MLNILVQPMEHTNGRTIIGPAAPFHDRASLASEEFDMVPGRNEPPDPVRPSQFNNYVTDTGVAGNGYSGSDTTEFANDSSVSIKTYINPYAKHGQRDYYNENQDMPHGKPGQIVDNRGRVLDGRMQYPGQQPFRFDRSIPRPAYMSFSDLVDTMGVY